MRWLRLHRTAAAFLALFTIAATASSAFYLSAGYDAGHGRFDQLYAMLGLPANLLFLALPDGVFGSVAYYTDWIWLVALPFLLNVAATLLLSSLWQRIRARRS